MAITAPIDWNIMPIGRRISRPAWFCLVPGCLPENDVEDDAGVNGMTLPRPGGESTVDFRRPLILGVSSTKPEGSSLVGLGALGGERGWPKVNPGTSRTRRPRQVLRHFTRELGDEAGVTALHPIHYFACHVEVAGGGGQRVENRHEPPMPPNRPRNAPVAVVRAARTCRAGTSRTTARSRNRTRAG